MKSGRRAVTTLFLLASASLTGCGGSEALGFDAITVLGPGVINDPANRSLRFDLLKFGLEQFCTEMTRRGAPLRLGDGQPVAGRFYAESCTSQVIDSADRKAFVIQFAGKGYGWTNTTQRLGFTSAGAVEFAPDFQVKDDAMWIYFRAQNLDANQFSTTLVESPLAQTGLAVTGTNPDTIGRNLIDAQLKRGFTVIRYSERGETDFSMGLIPVGQKPFKPFSIKSSDKVVLENSRTEVHTGQQDFIGGFEIKEDDQALFFTATLDGAPAVDLFVVPKGSGDLMLSKYTREKGPAALTTPPLLDETLVAGQTWKRFLSLPKGIYYLLVDNARGVGRTDPQPAAGDDQAAKIDYLVQLGDRP